MLGLPGHTLGGLGAMVQILWREERKRGGWGIKEKQREGGREQKGLGEMEINWYIH